MSKRNLINLILLAIVIVLVLLAVYEPGKQEKTKQVLSTLDQNSVTKITIKRIGVKDVELTKQGKDWFMTTPYLLQANNFKVEELLGLLSLKATAQYDLSKLDTKTYGLDKPRASITYNNQHTFEFGTTESLKNQRYVKHNNMLYVVPDIFYHRMSTDETDYLNHAILPGNNNITRLVLPNFSLTLQDGTWKIEPASTSYSNDQANELIENWRLSQAISIKKSGTQKTRQKISIYLSGSDRSIDFYILKHDKGFSLVRPDLGLEYEFANDKQKELLELPPKVEAELPDEATSVDDAASKDI